MWIKDSGFNHRQSQRFIDEVHDERLFLHGCGGRGLFTRPLRKFGGRGR